jgi:hypothetical protein
MTVSLADRSGVEIVAAQSAPFLPQDLESILSRAGELCSQPDPSPIQPLLVSVAASNTATLARAGVAVTGRPQDGSQ